VRRALFVIAGSSLVIFACSLWGKARRRDPGLLLPDAGTPS
jgi:hypothetical protein